VKRFGYKVNVIKVSDFLHVPQIPRRSIQISIRTTPESARIASLMDAGNKVRQISGTQEILALYAASAIASGRRDESPRKIGTHVTFSAEKTEECPALAPACSRRRVLFGDSYASEAVRWRTYGTTRI